MALSKLGNWKHNTNMKMVGWETKFSFVTTLLGLRRKWTSKGKKEKSKRCKRSHLNTSQFFLNTPCTQRPRFFQRTIFVNWEISLKIGTLCIAVKFYYKKKHNPIIWNKMLLLLLLHWYCECFAYLSAFLCPRQVVLSATRRAPYWGYLQPP